MKLEPAGKKYKLSEAVTYQDVTIPEGYLTDRITYKFRFVGIFISKYDPRYIKAVLFHDYLVDQGDWVKANQVFKELLPNDFRSKVMIVAVKLYGYLFGN